MLSGREVRVFAPYKVLLCRNKISFPSCEKTIFEENVYHRFSVASFLTLETASTKAQWLE